MIKGAVVVHLRKDFCQKEIAKAEHREDEFCGGACDEKAISVIASAANFAG